MKRLSCVWEAVGRRLTEGLSSAKKRLSVMDGEPILWFNQMYPRTSDTLSVKNSRIA